MSRFYNVKSDSRIRTLLVADTASSADPTLSDAVRTRCDFVNFGSRIYKVLSDASQRDGRPVRPVSESDRQERLTNPHSHCVRRGERNANETSEHSAQR